MPSLRGELASFEDGNPRASLGSRHERLVGAG